MRHYLKEKARKKLMNILFEHTSELTLEGDWLKYESWYIKKSRTRPFEPNDHYTVRFLHEPTNVEWEVEFNNNQDYEDVIDTIEYRMQKLEDKVLDF